VASAGGKTNLYLNTEKDFRAEGNFAVVLTRDAQTGRWAKARADHFVGRTIRATGTVKLNKDSPQVEVADEKRIEIIDNER
jgi:hypothetical protein